MIQIAGAIFIAVVTSVLIDRSKKWIDKLEEKFFGEDEKKEKE